VEVLPRFSDKRQAVDISQQIEQDVSVYLLTISTMNACMGMLTAITMKILRYRRPAICGERLHFYLNYIPIIGPLITASILLLVGLIGNG
jgi:predicted PurR-regulated permease PerM